MNSDLFWRRGERTTARSTAAKRQIAVSILAAFAGLYLIVFCFAFRSYAFSEPGGFPVFYTAGKLARLAGLSHLYQPGLQNIYHPGSIRSGGYFYHLPYEAVILMPLSWLTQPVAFAIWTIANLACLVAGAVVLGKHLPHLPVCLGVFAFAPLLSALINGQDVALLMLLLTLSFDGFVKGRDTVAGAFLGLGLFRIQFVVPLALVLAWRHRRFFWSFCATAATLMAGCWALVGTSGMLQFGALARDVDATEYAGCLPNLRGLFGMVSGSQHPLPVIAASCALLVYAASRTLSRPHFFAMSVLAAVLISYHAHFYDILLLAVPLVILLRGNLWPALIVFLSPIFLFWSHGIYLWAAITMALWAELSRQRRGLSTIIDSNVGQVAL